MSHEGLKHAVDVLSAGTVVATLASWLPPAAALFTLIWTLMRIWEMITGRNFADSRLARFFTRR